MTTIIGIYSPRGVIMAADQQATWKGGGIKGYGRKFAVSPEGEFVLGGAGVIDDAVRGLVKEIISGKISIQERVELSKENHRKRGEGDLIQNQKLEFPELAEVTLRRTGGKIIQPEDYNGFLLATRFGGIPEFYTCWPLGRIEPRFLAPDFYTSIGSGSEIALSYLGAKRKINEVEQGKNFWNKRTCLTIGQSIERSLFALRESTSSDLYSSGGDLILILPEGVFDCNDVFRGTKISQLKNMALQKMPKK